MQFLKMGGGDCTNSDKYSSYISNGLYLSSDRIRPFSFQSIARVHVHTYVIIHRVFLYMLIHNKY